MWYNVYSGEGAFFQRCPPQIYQKGRFLPVALSAAHKRAVAKYNAANYDRVELRLAKGQKEKLKVHAEKMGDDSLNAFINRAISEALERDRMRATKAQSDD